MHRGIIAGASGGARVGGSSHSEVSSGHVRRSIHARTDMTVRFSVLEESKSGMHYYSVAFPLVATDSTNIL